MTIRCYHNKTITVKKKNDMRNIVTLIIVLMAMNIHAQSLQDATLHNVSKNIIMEVVKPIETDVSFASVVVMETESGIVRSNINLTRTSQGWEQDDDYKHYVAAGNSRAVLFLALLECGASTGESYHTSGVFTDKQAGCTIKDYNRPINGWGDIRLDRAMNCSDIVILKACEAHFARSMGALAYYLGKTGIDLGDKEDERTYGEFCNDYENTPWDPIGILGYRDRITPLQMTIWMQGIANDGRMMMPRFYESDSTKTIYEQMALRCNIDSLKNAMRAEVECGTLRNVASEHVAVSGITNVSQENNIGYRCTMFCGFIPGYTISVNIVMKGSQTQSAHVSIARGIIDWIAQHRLNLRDDKK